MKMLKGKFVPQKQAILRAFYRAKYVFFREQFPKNSDGKTYLNLGCGPASSSEFINIDASPSAKTHILTDIQNLPMFKSNSVDLIYASHVIEHIPRGNLHNTLAEWFRVLKPGGILRFGVPHFDRLIEAYHASGNDVEVIVSQLLGQDGLYDDHHTIWNEAFAIKVLTQAGFTNVEAWDPASIDHHTFMDKTNRVLEVGEKKIPISLNLQATKFA